MGFDNNSITEIIFNEDMYFSVQPDFFTTLFSNNCRNLTKLILPSELRRYGDIGSPSTSEYLNLFQMCSNGATKTPALRTVSTIDGRPIKINNMGAAFSGCNNLTEVFPSMILSSGTNMAEAFLNCRSLHSDIKIQVEEGSGTTNLYKAFEGASMTNHFNCDFKSNIECGNAFRTSTEGATGVTGTFKFYTSSQTNINTAFTSSALNYGIKFYGLTNSDLHNFINTRFQLTDSTDQYYVYRPTNGDSVACFASRPQLWPTL